MPPIPGIAGNTNVENLQMTPVREVHGSNPGTNDSNTKPQPVEVSQNVQFLESSQHGLAYNAKY